MTRILVLLALVLAVLVAGLARPQKRVAVPSKQPDFSLASGVSFTTQVLGKGKNDPRITNIQIIDFDRDGLKDVLVCDQSRNAVILYRQTPQHTFEEHVLADGLNCPVHATAVDLDGDGDLDVVVSILGDIFPSDELVGKVVVLENEGNWKFTRQIILDDVRRVADVQAGDFNGDGKMDLAVAVFGYARGEILWLENRGKENGKWRFRDHQLLDRPGTIHVPVGDFNNDGKPDIAAVVSQDEEEVWIFENQGGGSFVPHRIYYSDNFDIGSAGLVAVDLNQDGKLDLLLPHGDNLEDRYSWPQPYHGCVWLENRGDWNFVPKKIGSFGGTYAAAAGDFDGDGHLDVVLASYLSDKKHPSLVWLKNDGHENFTTFKIDSLPIGLVTVAAGDLNGDGKADVVAGGLHLPPFPIGGYQGATIWLSRGGGKK